MHVARVGPGQDPTPDSANEAEHPDRVLAAPVLRFDLRTELEGLRGKQSYEKGQPTGRTLVKQPDLRIVLMTLRAGGRFTEHHASGPISIQAIEGRFRLCLPEGSIEVTSGELVALEPNIPHSIEAIEVTAFLLTIGRTMYQDVQDHHEPRA